MIHDRESRAFDYLVAIPLTAGFCATILLPLAAIKEPTVLAGFVGHTLAETRTRCAKLVSGVTKPIVTVAVATTVVALTSPMYAGSVAGKCLGLALEAYDDIIGYGGK